MIPKTRKEAFEVLRLSENTNEQEIKKAYKKFALKWHPDKWSDKSQEGQDIATEKFKEISVAYGILIGEIKEEFITQQPNDDWANRFAEYLKSQIKELRKDLYGSHLSEEEIDLFEVLKKRNLAKTKTLLKQVRNINAQTKLCDVSTGKSILHYIVGNSCNGHESGWRELLEEVLSKYSANNSTSVIDVNIISERHGTPLHIACELGSLDVVNVLLKHRADPNVHAAPFKYTPLYYALEESKNDIAKALLKHGAKIDASSLEGKLIIHSIEEYSCSTVEILLPYISSEQKNKMLQSIAYSDHVDPKKKSKLVKLFNEHKENVTNNNSYLKKQPSGRRWAIVGSALLFGAIGATLAAMGIIPEIAAIGAIATVVLSGIAGAVIGGVAGYLVDVTINQCCGNVQAKLQTTNT